MLCEDCKQKPATIHYTQVIGGVSRELHLCAACMKKHKVGVDLGDMHGLLSSLLSGMEGSGEETRTQSENVLRCSRCGMDFARFRKTGMLGCAQCYQEFRAQLSPILKRIHGRVQHAGHVPPCIDPARRAREEIERLKKDMTEAVAQEDFERAAWLRDQIRALAAAEKTRQDAEKAEKAAKRVPETEKEAADDAQ